MKACACLFLQVNSGLRFIIGDMKLENKIMKCVYPCFNHILGCLRQSRFLFFLAGVGVAEVGGRNVCEGEEGSRYQNLQNNKFVFSDVAVDSFT